MFKCKACGSTEFNLMLHPDFKGTVNISTNEHDEVVITAGSKEFIADLMFMNQYALCLCGEPKRWEYFFPKLAKNGT